MNEKEWIASIIKYKSFYNIFNGPCFDEDSYGFDYIMKLMLMRQSYENKNTEGLRNICFIVVNKIYQPIFSMIYQFIPKKEYPCPEKSLEHEIGAISNFRILITEDDYLKEGEMLALLIESYLDNEAIFPYKIKDSLRIKFN